MTRGNQDVHHVLLTALLLAVFARGASGQATPLDGDWNFVTDPAGLIGLGQLATAPNARTIHVPGSWQSQFSDLRDYAGVAWYWKTFRLPDLNPDRVWLLKFGAVDYRADAFVNGLSVGTHEGGYLPFEFDITPNVHPGENQIALRVIDPGAKPSEVEGISYAEVPHGKQNWYVQTSGIWQSVALEARPRMHLGRVHITAGADGKFRIETPIINPPSKLTAPSQLYAGAEILNAANQPVWKQAQDLRAGQGRCTFSGAVSKPSLWSPASPALYTLHTWLSSGDSGTIRFGFRTFETRGGKFYLNGKVIYLRGALDQDFYPETVYTPPSLDYLKNEMVKAKALGLNLLRCHIKVPDPRYLQAADEVGLLVWYEIPNWDKLTDSSKRRGVETLRGMVERDWNHPSIVAVSIINESWGVDLSQLSDRRWLKQTYGLAGMITPGWLVDDNSACCKSFHVATDLADFHQYDAIPDHAGDFDRVVSDLAERPAWLFSPYADAAPKGNEPLMLSELGNWGLPRFPDPEPWWFARSFQGKEITLPAGVRKRFTDYQYGSLFPSPEALAEATQWHEYQSLKHEIESLRAHPEIQGYVITELTDVNWESNGLMDWWRRPKVFADSLAKLQQDDVVVVRAERRNFTSGETVQAEIDFSHYSQDPLAGAEVEWQLEGDSETHVLALPATTPGSVTPAGKIEFVAPATRAPAARRVSVRVEVAGKSVAEDSLDLFFYPRESPDWPPAVSFHDPTGRLRRLVTEMRGRGYLEPSGTEALPVLVTSVFDDRVKKTLRGGGRVILIANDRQTLAPGLEILPRAGSDLDGDWVSSFNWIRKGRQPFKAIGFDILPGFETQAATPRFVLQGVPPRFFGDVLSGIFYGWIRSNVATLAQAKAGRGRLLICTWPLATTYGDDPFATYLLDALVSEAVAVRPLPDFEVSLPAE